MCVERRIAASASEPAARPTIDRKIAAERTPARMSAPLPLQRLFMAVIHRGDGSMGAIERMPTKSGYGSLLRNADLRIRLGDAQVRLRAQETHQRRWIGGGVHAADVEVGEPRVLDD